MSVIRHICGGHEYRYDTEARTVANNYGTIRAILKFSKVSGTAMLFDAENVDRINLRALLATSRHLNENSSAADLAKFAIGYTALYIREN